LSVDLNMTTFLLGGLGGSATQSPSLWPLVDALWPLLGDVLLERFAVGVLRGR
jgi:hypothetical protein